MHRAHRFACLTFAALAGALGIVACSSDDAATPYDAGALDVTAPEAATGSLPDAGSDARDASIPDAALVDAADSALVDAADAAHVDAADASDAATIDAADASADAPDAPDAPDATDAAILDAADAGVPDAVAIDAGDAAIADASDASDAPDAPDASDVTDASDATIADASVPDAETPDAAVPDANGPDAADAQADAGCTSTCASGIEFFGNTAAFSEGRSLTLSSDTIAAGSTVSVITQTYPIGTAKSVHAVYSTDAFATSTDVVLADDGQHGNNAQWYVVFPGQAAGVTVTWYLYADGCDCARHYDSDFGKNFHYVTH